MIKTQKSYDQRQQELFDKLGEPGYKHPEDYIPLVGAVIRGFRFEDSAESFLELLMKQDIPCFRKASAHQNFIQKAKEEMFSFKYILYHEISTFLIGGATLIALLQMN